VALLAAAHPAAAAGGPTVGLSPGAPFHDGEAVTVSVGPNGLFTPHSRVNVLECADPGGTVANLPRDVSTCDGNSIQGNTVLVATNGSFSAADYTIYQLPSPALGEQSNYQPDCNASQSCVLFVGEDQNDFTKPHVFSAPFTVAPAGAVGTTTAPVPTTVAAAGSVESTTSVPTAGAATTPAGGTPGSGGTLAFTGGSIGLFWLAAAGGLLVVAGSAGRHRALRGLE